MPRSLWEDGTTLRGTHTAHHCHSKKPLNLHQAEILWFYQDETAEVESSKEARWPRQSSAQPLLQVPAGKGRARAGEQPVLPHPCTLGPPSGRTASHLQKCRRGSEYRNRRGKTQVGGLWVARIIPRWPASYEVPKFVALKHKYKLPNVNTSQACAKQPISTDCSPRIQEITFPSDNSK